MLQLDLLGRPFITYNQQNISSELSDKAVALLSYLALHPGEHSRETLAGLLWGNLPAARTKANLRLTLHHIGKVLPSYLQLTRKTAAFDHSQPHQIDVKQFEAAAATTAVDLYRDDLLTGLYVDNAPEFEIWLLMERERLRLRLLGLLETAVAHFLAADDQLAAIRALRRAIAVEPWREASHRQLMRLLALQGDYAAALKQFEHCQQLLHDELGVVPMPETVELAERIRHLRQQPRHNLPRQPMPLVGRSAEIAQIRARLRQTDSRLVSIVGAGGMGKTRLALAVGEALVGHYLEGVAFLSLAAVESGESLPQALLNQFIQHGFMPAPSGQQPPLTALLAALQGREMLLILDNVEQLLPQAADTLLALVEETAVQLLITSRQRLNLRWEQVVSLSGLSHSREDWRQSASAQFLQQVARRVYPSFALTPNDEAAMRQLWQLTQGMPLALELAAGWLRLHSLTAVVAKIAQSHTLLAASRADVPARQRSVLATFDYSWALLSAPEHQALQQLALLPSPFGTDLAQALTLANGRLLLNLVDKSLVQPAPPESSQPIYQMHPLLRQYAQEKLDEAVATSAWRRLAGFYCEQMPLREEALRGQGQQETLDWVQHQIENLRAVWHWAVQQSDSAVLTRLVYVLTFFYTERGWYQQGLADLETAVAHFDRPRLLQDTPETALALTVARLQLHKARLHNYLEEKATAVDILALCLPVFEAHGALWELGLCWRGLGVLNLEKDIVLSLVYYQKSLDCFHAVNDLWEAGRTLVNMSVSQAALGTGAAVASLEESIGIFDELGDQIERTRATLFLASQHTNRGHFTAAIERVSGCVAQYEILKDMWGLGLSQLAMAALHRYIGQYAAAQAYCQQALVAYEALAAAEGVGRCWVEQALICVAQGDALGAETAVSHVSDVTEYATTRLRGLLSQLAGQWDEAIRYLQQTVTLAASYDVRRHCWARTELGWALLAAERREAALAQFVAALRQALQLQLAPHGLAAMAGCALTLRPLHPQQAAQWGRFVAAQSQARYQTRQKTAVFAHSADELQMQMDWQTLAAAVVPFAVEGGG